MTTWLDYTLLALLALLFPILGHRSYQKLQKRLAAGETGARIKSYRQTMLLEWSLLAAVALIWLLADRTLEALGFATAAPWRFGLGMAVAVAVTALFAWQARSLPRAPAEDQEKLRCQLESVFDFCPHDRCELRSFSFLSVAAGVCEEIVYRGYLIWLLGGFGGTLFAVIGSSVIFALGHSYQGVQGMVKVFLVGLGMAALYLVSGSLWAPILLHVGADIFQGLLAYRLLTDRPGSPAALDSAPEAA